MAYIWPIVLLVIGNILYNICAKSIPEGMDAFASMVPTYLVATLASLACYFVFNREGNFTQEVAKFNWATIALGIVIVSLEVGFIYAFKVGWPVNITYILQSAFVAVGLVFVGYLLYREPITFNKAVGTVICLIGLWFLNK